MGLKAGAKLGPYEIIGAAGAGGMGEVYRARDTRLDRVVALKVLPSHLSSHPDLRQRLDREARAVSKLSHPHICALFDIGHQDGVDFLVLEYLEGETLLDRLRRGPLPPDQLLRYAIEIADALQNAHRHGIVHRDLKPGNVMLTKSGAKLLDFGLARATAETKPGAELVTMVTEGDRPLTAEGSIVGTFQYMAPEQLEGAAADQRSDIFAFGAILHEMATGKPAFSGKTRASLIASILASEPPPVSSLQPVTPPELDRVIRHCLAKDPASRWQSIHDVKLGLEGIREGSAARPATAPARPLWIWALAALLLVGAAFLLGFWVQKGATTRTVYRAALQPPPGHSYLSYQLAVSPDGTRLAFAATGADGISTLWVRSLANDSSQEFSGTQGATQPFWSPDGKFVGFFAEAKLKKVDVASGAVQNICDAILGRGGTWNRDGMIVFAPHIAAFLMRVPASGGEPVIATKLPENSGESHRWPIFLPDGRHFLYYVDWSENRNGLYVATLDKPEGVLISRDIRSNLQFAAGHLLFVRDGTLFAQPFDPDKLRFTGDPLPIANQELEQDMGFGNAGFSVSNTGVLVYQSRRSYSSHLIWFDRSGKELEAVGPPAAYDPRLSRDGRLFAVTWDAANNGRSRIHVVDPKRGTVTAVAEEADRDSTPVWSPDSSRIAFSTVGEVIGSIKVRSADGSGEPQVLDSGPRVLTNDWTRDGRYVIYMKFLHGLPALWAYDFLQKKPFLAAMGSGSAAEGQVSPDGHWLAYTSTHRGGVDVFIQPFPGPGPRIQISNNGGTQSRWRADGKELYYIAQGKLMAVSIKAGSTLEVGRPVALFQTRIHGARYALFQYDVSADGQLFLINSLPREDAAAPMTLLTDWTVELKH